MAYTTYILFSESAGKYYTGHTQDLSNRIQEHNKGETSSIKVGIPWKLVWSHEFETRAEAMALESKIKKRGARRFIEDTTRGA
jgi:putative endonuclease